MRRLLIAAVVVGLAGCSVFQSHPDVGTEKIIDAQIRAAERPTFSITCPPTGCVVGNVSYTDPRQGQGLKLPTNGWDTLSTAIGTVGGVATSAIVPAAMATTAIRGFQAVRDAKGGDVTTITTTSTTADSHNVDSTHAPTVVTQPAPAIVTQPAPLVVQPVVVTVP